MLKDTVDFIRSSFNSSEFIPLHEPRFVGNEKKYLNECIDTSFVSSVGKFVDRFEEMIADYLGVRYAIATSNGTSALHVSLLLAGVVDGDEVITQPLTFVATCNAISYCNASPVFIDVDRANFGLSAEKFESFLSDGTYQENGKCVNKLTKKIIRACVPMHTFGHIGNIVEIAAICDRYNIVLIEDAAESLGSVLGGRHAGTFGLLGAISFNGNKIITSGGGGCIVTNDENLALKAKHITTTAKVPHKWAYEHDHVAYNYRMPNLNAALLVAQLEKIDVFVANKRQLAFEYGEFFDSKDVVFIREPESSKSNYWLNSIVLEDRAKRDSFLEFTNEKGVMTRPIWGLMNKLEMFERFQCSDLSNSDWLVDRVVNIPSSVRL